MKNLIWFLVGAAAGVGGSALYFKKKYEKISKEEIESVKAYYKSKSAADLNEAQKLAAKEQLKNESAGNDISEPEEAKEVAANIAQTNDYTAYSKPKAKKPVKKEVPDIELISNREWDQDLAHDKRTLTFYLGDHTLADEDDELDTYATIGSDALNHFGDFEEDVVFVRNNKLGIDYEVIKDYGSFSDIVGD